MCLARLVDSIQFNSGIMIVGSGGALVKVKGLNRTILTVFPLVKLCIQDSLLFFLRHNK